MALERLFKSFARNRRGSIPALFAMLFLFIVLAVGMALDLSYLLSVRLKYDAALDEASLSIASSIRKAMLNCGSTCSATTSAQSGAQALGRAVFDANAGKMDHVNAVSFTAAATISGSTISVTSSYSASYIPYIMSIAGFKSIPIGRTNSARAVAATYMEVTIVVDTSGSMAIGVDNAAQQALIASYGCAFACHDDSAVWIGGRKYSDAYAFAKSQGIPLRYDAVNQGVSALIDEFDKLDAGGNFIKAQLLSFNTSFTTNQGLTYDRRRLRSSLPSAPSTSGVAEGGTLFNEGIGAIVSSLGKGGDGSSPSAPIKLVIFATDGAQDPGRFAVWNWWQNYLVDAFDMTFCSNFKKNGVIVGFVHTPYVPMTWDWGYNATLGQRSQRGGSGTRNDDITVGLRECAGANYVLATDAASIVSGFVKIFGGLAVPRLTK